MRQGCSLSPYLLNLYTQRVIDKIREVQLVTLHYPQGKTNKVIWLVSYTDVRKRFLIMSFNYLGVVIIISRILPREVVYQTNTAGKVFACLNVTLCGRIWL